jgi:transposase
MGMPAHYPASIKSFFDQPHLSEETALKETILAADLRQGDLVVFDKGLKSRKTFQAFDNQNINFITTGSTNIRYEVLQTHRNIKGRKADALQFIQDVKVHLYGDSNQLIEHPFRLIEAEILESGERIFFITNVWDLSAMQIARIYKHRWDIEVFYRFIKQQLNIKHLINRSENGVKIQIFSALIAAILVLVFKIGNKIPSYKIAKLKFEDDLLLLIVNELREKTPP